MTDDFSPQRNEQRIQALLDGRWGESLELRRRSRNWYESLGIPGDLAELGRLHPVVEYVANCLDTGDQCLIDGSGYLRSLPVVESQNDMVSSWAVTDDGPDRDLQKVVQARRSEFAKDIQFPNSQQDAMLHEAIEQLSRVAADLTSDALSFTRRHLLMVSSRMVGRTWVDLGGLIVSGDPAFRSVDTLAESLFHESLHSKFYTIERGLTDPSPDEESSPTPVSIPWQMGSDGSMMEWTAERTLDAFYVYIHLAALRMAWYAKVPSDDHIERMRRIAFRSAYLSKELRTTCAGMLDDERDSIYLWLDACRVPAFDLNEEGERLLLSV